MSIRKITLKSGESRYRVKTSIDGKNVIRVFDREIDAKCWLKMQVVKNEIPLVCWRPESTEQLCHYWLMAYASIYKQASTVKRDEGIIRNHILPYFRNRPIEELRPSEIELWFFTLRNRGELSIKSCNDILVVFAKIMTDAVRWQFIKDNPARVIRKLRLPEQSFKFWNKEEVQRVLAYPAETDTIKGFQNAVIVALYTGMRRGELMALNWSNIDFDSQMLTVEKSYCMVLKGTKATKSGKIRHIPMSHNLVIFLRNLQNSCNCSSLVLNGVNWDATSKALKRLGAKAGVRPIRFHDLRHTFASNFLMGGGNIYNLQKILGHSTIQVTERYAHLVPDHLRGATEVLGF